MINDIKQGIRSLLLQRLRTFLSALGIFFGVAALIAMLAIGEGAKQETLRQIEQLGMNHIILRQTDLTEAQQQERQKQYVKGLTLMDAQIISNLSCISANACFKVLKGNLQIENQAFTPEILAVSPSFFELKGLDVNRGRLLCPLDQQQKQHVCILGYDVAKELGKKGHVSQNISIDHISFKIVGILDHKHWIPGKTNVMTSRNLNRIIYVPLGIDKTLPRKTWLHDDALTEIAFQVKSNQDINQTAKTIHHILNRTHKGIEDYQVVIPQELQHQANRTQMTFNIVLGSVAAISLLVGGIGIMNIMLANVTERTREIGIRRAVGANQYHIAKQFLVESLLLTLSGVFLGILGALALTELITYYAEWESLITLWSVLLAVSMATLVGLCSALYPAVKAARMNPINALRHF
ncbi:ABC transporter permease [Parachlamydia acanthamoebae]|jgi:putative ABC transport system permease protein|uniref:ABC transporter permease n=1 Tax=Parachlamydia acanthamoebae TaxID=83552 RepID=UPI000750CC12|nr:ABC transporter permease [Parachlamydia acanthamoebae]